MKKYFFFAAAALLALAACSKVTPVELPDEEISFNVVNYVNSTKADAQDHLEYTGTFGVFAYANTVEWDNDDANTAGVYMNNVPISKVGNVWKNADQAYYWPKQAMLTFAAYSPYKETAPTFAKASGFTFTNYSIPAAANEDLMVADLAKDLKANVTTAETENAAGYHFTEGVPILFHHLLTSLQFKFQQAPYDNDNVKEADSKITVTEVKLLNFVGQKTYTNAAWAGNDVAGNVSYTVYEKGEGSGTDIAKKSANNPTLLGAEDVIIMPQTLVNPNPAEGEAPTVYQLLKVTYTITTEYVSGAAIVESDLVAYVPFYFAGKAEDTSTDPVTPAVPAITSFNKNQKIVYTVTIYPYAKDEILFDPAVKVWDETTGTLEIK